MGSRKYNYFLVWRNLQIPLFESQFRFASEDQCLRHYEKGIARAVFAFKRASIDQVWSELALWGLIGRICPIELVRILCAFGCEIATVDGGGGSFLLKKSYMPVTYLVPIDFSERPSLRHLYDIEIEPIYKNKIPMFLDLSDCLVIGSFYTDLISDIDSQFSKFCRLLESDLCLQPRVVSVALSKLFWRGFKIRGIDQSGSHILAQRDLTRNIIQGFRDEETLFYLSSG